MLGREGWPHSLGQSLYSVPPAGTEGVTAAVAAFDVVVVFHSRPDELDQTLRSIRREPDARIVVVDVSDDAGAGQADADVYVRHPNEGYAAACHAGFARTTSDVVVFSNSDVVYDGGALRRLVELARSRGGAAFPVQRAKPGEPIHLDSLLPVPSLRAATARWLWFGRRRAELERRAVLAALADDDLPLGDRYVGSGATFAIARPAWIATGGLPPSIFLHHEDIVLGVRLKEAGIPSYLCPTAGVVHLGGHRGRAPQSGARLSARSEREAWRLLSRRGIAVLAMIQLAGISARSPWALAAPRHRERAPREVVLAFDARVEVRDGTAVSVVPMNAELFAAVSRFRVLACFRPLHISPTQAACLPGAAVACRVDWEGIPGPIALTKCAVAIWRAGGDAVVGIGPGVLPSIALLLGWIRRVPARRRIYLLNTVPAEKINTGEYVRNRWLRRLVALSARLTTAASAASAGTKLAVSRYAAPSSRGWLITPEVPDAALERVPRSTERAGVLFVGSLENEKGVDVALEAFRLSLPAHGDARLTIVGEGRARQRLEQRAAESCPPGSVEFVGREDHASALRRMAEAQVVLVPSSHGEAFGLVAFEAAFLGAWVLAADAGGLPEAVAPFANATCVENWDPDTWAMAITARLAVPPPIHAYASVDQIRLATGWQSVGDVVARSLAES